MGKPPEELSRTLVSAEDTRSHPPGSASAWLLVAGTGQVLSFPLPPTGEVVIGRAPECQVSIDHPKLSRRHAILTMGHEPTLKDLGSTNGTRLHGQKLPPDQAVPLPADESFQVGPFSLLVVRAKKTGESSQSISGANSLVVTDPTPRGVNSFVKSVAASPLPVLILGETGAGKEMLAQTVHDLSKRKGPLLRLNCAAVSESLLESELFGHERGAFTGAIAAKAGLLESAAGGTVFLDEVGEMPAGAQAKLLRAVETGEVMRVGSVRPTKLDVRFIAATNRDLQQEIVAKNFRADLYYRLSAVTLEIPPLRARRGMIGPLALLFLTEAVKRIDPNAQPNLSPSALAVLQAYEWPGNVRELKASIERAALMARGGEIKPQHLSLGARSGTTVPPTATVLGVPAPAESAPMPAAVAAPDALPPAPEGLSAEEEAERQRIVAALDACAGNQTRAAQMLGISRATLVNKLAIYRLPRPRKR
jgi:DNA-binding NtrC family response regulator